MNLLKVNLSRVAEGRTGFQSQLMNIMRGSSSSSSSKTLSREEQAIVQAASLFEQLANPVDGLKSSARVLQNVIKSFPWEARPLYLQIPPFIMRNPLSNGLGLAN